MSMSNDPRRNLPSVDRLASEVRRRDPNIPVWAAQNAARNVVSAARRRLSTAVGSEPGAIDAPDALVSAAVLEAEDSVRSKPSRVINATGVVLHTNLGRAPLALAAAEAAANAGRYYGDLELDLASGRRGDRTAHVARRLQVLSGAEAAHAVNNNAAALMLAVNTLARGREVVVSRGELVEIGGSFRLPEILAAAGARLVEVGTTNRTRPEDYANAIRSETALLLKVHPSNFEQRGFVREAGLGELAPIARAAGVPLLEDLGSGMLVDLRGEGWPEASYVPARLRLGADILCFSGDKLLGGPQAGLLLGAAQPIAAMRRNPLARAFRLDKMSLAALHETLGLLLAGEVKRIPTLRMLCEPAHVVEKRARELQSRLGELCQRLARSGLAAHLETSRAPVGGGSVPGHELASTALRLSTPTGSAEALAAALRRQPIPVIARVHEGDLWFDLRTIADEELAPLVETIETAFASVTEGGSV